MSSDESDSSGDEAVEEIERNFDAEAQLIVDNLLPQRSMDKYNKVHETFMEWHSHNASPTINENVMLVYFKDLSTKYKPSTLWSKWSMLKTTLNLRNRIKIDNFLLLKGFLKEKSKRYKPKKSKVLSWSDILAFLRDSPDAIYLVMKVVV